MKLKVTSSFSLLFVASGLWLATLVQVVDASVTEIVPSSQVKAVGDRGVLERPACSSLSIEILTTNLLRDLPSYANRVTQRSRRLARKNEVYSYMVLAGNPDFTPLPLNPGSSTTATSSATLEDVKQVFFTTLERQYTGRRAIQLQQFYWLFLTKTETGWQMVLMFTQTGTYPLKQPPTPPRDSSDSAVAQAVRNWLRDCQAGSLRKLI